MTRIYATILVERESQKPIVIGRGGNAHQADRHRGTSGDRKLFQSHVFLDLRVAVRERWREDERMLDELGVRSPEK